MRAYRNRHYNGLLRALLLYKGAHLYHDHETTIELPISQSKEWKRNFHLGILYHLPMVSFPVIVSQTPCMNRFEYR